MNQNKIIQFSIALCFIIGGAANNAFACDVGIFKAPPTDQTKTFIRKGNGEWNAPRDGGAHGGVDIITNMSLDHQSSYAVKSVAQGVVAYSRINGTQETGYGNLMVIDHENGCYSLYGHLASSPFTPMNPGGNLLRKVGDKVGPGETIGYFVDIKSDVDSTGNARRTAPEARHQVHFELIAAPSGRKGDGSLKIILKEDGRREDPTGFLKTLGYSVK
jgi:murein DD-endopeptidase MepM/ murein hydrolase activator NlpD